MSKSEFQVIQQYFADSNLSFEREGVVLGIGDDAALINSSSLVSHSLDLLIADVHFPASAPADLVAKRALAVNLSDLAAMGASPLCFTLGLSIPSLNPQWLEEFSAGLAITARAFNCPLVGGDLTRSKSGSPVTIAIQVQGEHVWGSPIKRSGALLGDDIYVTGFLGDGALAVESLGYPSHLGCLLNKSGQSMSTQDKKHFHDCYFDPKPRVDCAAKLNQVMHSAIDISDGLFADLSHILERSEVGAQVELNHLPISKAAKANASIENSQKAALFGGDDYELCFTSGKENRLLISNASEELNLAITRIGEIVEGSTLSLFGPAGQLIEFEERAYDHFA